MNSLMERYVKVIKWSINQRFPSDVLEILDSLSMFDMFESLLIIHQMIAVSVFAMRWTFFVNVKKTELVNNWGNFKFELVTMTKKVVSIKKNLN